VIPALNAAVRARDAYALSLLGSNTSLQERTRNAALEAGTAATTALRAFDKNRSRTAGDRTAQRKAGARAAPSAASSSLDLIVTELQSLRRGVHALVEAKKLVR
jgi:hypothetical protein